MIFDEPYNLVRVATLVVAIYCLGQAVFLYPWWRKLPRHHRLILLALLIFVVTGGYGTGEAYYAELPGGPRVIFMLVGFLYCSIGLTMGVRAVRRAPIKK